MGYEKGLVLKIEGLEGIETSREDMKALFEGHNINWVNFNKGDAEAFIRFEGSAEEALDKVKVDEKFMLSGRKQPTRKQNSSTRRTERGNLTVDAEVAEVVVN